MDEGKLDVINMRLHEIKEIGVWQHISTGQYNGTYSNPPIPTDKSKSVYIQRVIGGWNYLYEGLGVVFVANTYNHYKERT